MILRIFPVILTLLAAAPLPALAQDSMSVQQAYEAIPHARTPYDAKQSRAPAEDKKYLDHLFFVTDQAMRLRVQTLRQFLNLNPHHLKEYNRDIENLLSSFDLITVPPHLHGVHNKIVTAIRDQREFFNDWNRQAGTQEYMLLMRQYRDHGRVRSSHRALYEAYLELKEIYPGETEHNLQAFYDHLCSLDFI